MTEGFPFPGEALALGAFFLTFFRFSPFALTQPHRTLPDRGQVKQNERLTLAHVSVTLAELLGRLPMTGPARVRTGLLTDPEG